MRQRRTEILLCAVLAFALVWICAGGSACAENTPNELTLTVHTWISGDSQGSEAVSAVQAGDTIYFNFELQDSDGNACDPALYGMGYQVTITVTAENGTVMAQNTVSNTHRGSIGVSYPSNATGLQTGKAAVSGDVTAEGQSSWRVTGGGPEIVIQPTAKIVQNGKTAVFRVSATGSALTYSWYYTTEGSANAYTVSGGTTDTLRVVANAETSGRSYFCKVSDGSVSVTSNKALLTTQYVVSFDANGGESAPAGQKKNHGIPLKLTSAKPALTGYDFIGWALDEDSDTADYVSGAAFSADEDTTLYAVWKRQTYSIQFDCGGGENGPEALNKTYGIAVRIPDETPIRKGYLFRGWSVSDAATSAGYLPGDMLRLEGSRKLYAVWDPKAVYTVSYDANGGSGAPPSQQKVSENPLQLSETVPEWEEHRFLGWAETASANSAQYSAGAFYEKDASVTLYAVWGTARIGMDFNPARDAYSFNNSQSSFAYTSRGPGEDKYPIRYETFRILFGDGVAGKSKFKSTVLSAWGGNCCGMSSTAAIFYANGMNPADFGSAVVNNLTISGSNGQISVLTFIEVMQIAQFTDAFAVQYKNNKLYRYQIEADGSRLGRLYQAVETAAQSGVGTIIGIGKTGVGGHALLAYGVETVSATQDRLLIYDCNFPNRECSLYLDKAEDGTYTGWTYDMGGYGIWGITDENQSSCFISYIPYSTIISIWNNRGRLYDNRELLTFSGGNLSIRNMSGQEVARITNGRLSQSSSGVVEMPNLSMNWSNTLGVFLPRDYYTVSSSDSGTLSVTMTDVAHSATVTTTADSISFAVDSYTNENTVFIENASENDTYSVLLETTQGGARYGTVSVSGFGQDGSLTISGNDDTLSILNCNISSLSINGEEKVAHLVSAYAGPGGTVSPAGDSVVVSGDSIAYTITPDPGYAIASVRLDDIDMGSMETYTFQNVNRSHTIAVQFVKTAAIVSVSYDSAAQAVDAAFQYDGDARLVCAVYAKDGRMMRTVIRTVSAGTTEAKLSLAGIQVPHGGKIKVMLADMSWRPLCASRELNTE